MMQEAGDASDDPENGTGPLSHEDRIGVGHGLRWFSPNQVIVVLLLALVLVLLIVYRTYWFF